MAALTAANDSIEMLTLVEAINGIKLKMDTYPERYRPMVEDSLRSLEAEFLRRQNELWISPNLRPIPVEGESDKKKFTARYYHVSFYTNGDYSVDGVYNDRGPLHAMRYYATLDDAHAAGVKWQAINGLAPTPVAYMEET
jgi:hypothetical protein